MNHTKNNTITPFPTKVAEENKDNKSDQELQLDRFGEMLQTESIKRTLNNTYDEIQQNCDSLRGSFKCEKDLLDIIEEKIKQYTPDQLEQYLKSNEHVEEFFTDPETGKPVELTIDTTKDREIEFKRGYLVYIKTSQEAFANIDAKFDELDNYTKEMNIEIQDAVNALSDNVLAYISSLTDKANAMDDTPLKKKLLTTIKHIRSGYDMTVFSEVLDKYPSVAEKCVKELEQEVTIQTIGKRYQDKLASHGVKTSLVRFASDIDHNKQSFEEIMLVREEQYIVPDLFIYSLIRFFAMADWSNNDIHKAHASISLVLERLMRNEFIDEVKTDIINSIVKYIAKFKTN